MADMRIDDATRDAQVTGVELLPASDGGQPRAVSTEKIKDYMLARIAALAAAAGVDTSADGVYLLKGGELKPVAASVLAAAVLDYAFALSAVISINGNEKVSVKDGTTKKTVTLNAMRSWLLSDVSETQLAATLAAMQTAIAGKVTAVTGKGLSKNDYTDEEKTKLAGLVGNSQGDWSEADSSKPSFIKNKPTIPPGVTVDHALDTESQNAIANDIVAARFAGIDADITGLGDEIDDLDDAKVDKVPGKGLSKNDLTDALLAKLNAPKVPLVANTEGVVAQGATCALKVAGHAQELSGSDGGVVAVNFGTEAAPDWRVLYETYAGVAAGHDGHPMRYMVYDNENNPLNNDFTNLPGLHAPQMLLYDVQAQCHYMNVKAKFNDPDNWQLVHLFSAAAGGEG